MRNPYIRIATVAGMSLLLSGCLASVVGEAAKVVPGGGLVVDAAKSASTAKPDRTKPPVVATRDEAVRSRSSQRIGALEVRIKRLESKRPVKPSANCRSIRKQYAGALFAKRSIEKLLAGKSGDDLAERLEGQWQQAYKDMIDLSKRYLIRPCPGMLTPRGTG